MSSETPTGYRVWSFPSFLKTILRKENAQKMQKNCVKYQKNENL